MHNCDTPPIDHPGEHDPWLCPECGKGWRLWAACDLAHPDNVLVIWQPTSWPAPQPD